MKSHKINQFFGRYAAFLLRWRWAAIALFAVILIVSFIGMSKMVQQTSFDDYFIGILTECDNHFTKESLTLMRELGEELLDSLSCISTRQASSKASGQPHSSTDFSLCCF